jgi:CubicO group peptidase (beta-lactamase class C family)
MPVSFSFRLALWVFLVFLASSIASVRAQDLQVPETFEHALEALRSKHNLPGLIAGQFDTQKLLQVQAVGFRRWGVKDPLLAEHPMHLGSCTKSMTATLVAMAIDEGLLGWDSTLGEVFASDAKVTGSSWANVTVRQMMHHTSGAPANAPWAQFTDPAMPICEHRRNALHWWMEQPFEPKRPASGSPGVDAPGFLYSNLGYMALGGVLEQIRQQDWEEQIRERLFSPLGMRSAGFGIPSKSLGEKAPWGHIRPVGLLVAVERDNPRALGPAGTVYASMEDWVRYLQVHLRRKSSDTPVLKLSAESFDRLHQPAMGESYAGGWNVIRRGWSAGPIYTHNGSNTVWYCVVFLAPGEGRGIFAACNFGLDAAGPCDEALQWMLKNLPFDSELKSP